MAHKQIMFQSAAREKILRGATQQETEIPVEKKSPVAEIEG